MEMAWTIEDEWLDDDIKQDIIRIQKTTNITVCQFNTGLVGDEAGCHNDHFIARIQDRAGSQIQCFGCSDGHDDLIFRIVADAVKSIQTVGNGLTQFRQTGIGGVMRIAPFQWFVCFSHQSVRCCEVRFADSQRDNITRYGKILSNGGRFQILNAYWSFIPHKYSPKKRFSVPWY